MISRSRIHIGGKLFKKEAHHLLWECITLPRAHFSFVKKLDHVHMIWFSDPTICGLRLCYTLANPTQGYSSVVELGRFAVSGISSVSCRDPWNGGSTDVPRLEKRRTSLSQFVSLASPSPSHRHRRQRYSSAMPGVCECLPNV